MNEWNNAKLCDVQSDSRSDNELADKGFLVTGAAIHAAA